MEQYVFPFNNNSCFIASWCHSICEFACWVTFRLGCWKERNFDNLYARITSKYVLNSLELLFKTTTYKAIYFYIFKTHSELFPQRGLSSRVVPYSLIRSSTIFQLLQVLLHTWICQIFSIWQNFKCTLMFCKLISISYE